MVNRIVEEDLQRVFGSLSEREREALADATVLVTGCAGFLGFYLLGFLTTFGANLGIKRVIGVDNFQMGRPAWLERIGREGDVDVYDFNVTTDDIGGISGASEATHVLHMASIASPTFYREYPIETLDANVWGLRRLLDFYREKPVKGLAFFSSSEVYGDPAPDCIPTPEDYRGNVSCQGSRACYDEAKRFGETLCYLYHQQYGMPLRVIRPFNNYGPGMRLNDARVPADFAKAVFEHRDIVMFSDGSPRRTFCYVSDAVVGYLKVLLHTQYGVFNIGTDTPEISIKELAAIYVKEGRDAFGYGGKATFRTSDDPQYLSNNPCRRCPDISKARRLLGYEPKIAVQDGVKRFLAYIKQTPKNDLIW